MTAHQVISRVCLPVLLVGLILAAVNMRTPLVMLGSVAPMVATELGLTTTMIGLLGALPMPLFAFGALVSARLARRFGLHRMMIVMTLLLAMGVATRSWFGATVLFIGTLILSFAIGMLNALIAPFIKQHAAGHITVATGVFSLSMSAMAGVGAWAVVPLSEYWGWRVSMSFWAVFSLAAALIWWRFADKPTVADGAEFGTRYSVWHNHQAWHLAAFLGLQSLLFYSIASFLPAIVMSYGATLQQAVRLALVCQLMALPAIIGLTYLMRRGVSVRLLAIVGTSMNALAVAGLLFMPTQMLMWSVLMGLGCAMVFTLSLMMFSLKTTTTEMARDLSSMAQAIGYSIAFFGPFLLGWLYQWQGDWQLPLAVLLLLMLVNVGFAWTISQTKIDG